MDICLIATKEPTKIRKLIESHVKNLVSGMNFMLINVPKDWKAILFS